LNHHGHRCEMGGVTPTGHTSCSHCARVGRVTRICAVQTAGSRRHRCLRRVEKPQTSVMRWKWSGGDDMGSDRNSSLGSQEVIVRSEPGSWGVTSADPPRPRGGITITAMQCEVHPQNRVVREPPRIRRAWGHILAVKRPTLERHCLAGRGGPANGRNSTGKKISFFHIRSDIARLLTRIGYFAAGFQP
jgi:hypothetical protein